MEFWNFEFYLHRVIDLIPDRVMVGLLLGIENYLYHVIDLITDRAMVGLLLGFEKFYIFMYLKI